MKDDSDRALVSTMSASRNLSVFSTLFPTQSLVTTSGVKTMTNELPSAV
jgi:hypothetical protein